MLESGYRVGQPLALAPSLWRARSEPDGPAVLLWSVHDEGPSPETLRATWEALRGLALPGVPRAVELDEPRGRLVLEDMGGALLGALLAGGPLGVEAALAIALGLAETLAVLHEEHGLRADLRPSRVLVHPATHRAQLFGLRGREAPAEASGLERLRYASPEETGRTGRVPDERSDLYALGALLHEMLAGGPPFAADDPLELVHAHLALDPPPLRERAPAVPEPVAELVRRLLSKSVEARYQSARGAALDLGRCLAQWRARGAVAPFPLGADDVSARLTIPSQLYGREREERRLRKAFERLGRGGQPLLLITGDPGVGKTSLVGLLRRPVEESGGRFASGKFDQLDRTTPYGALLQALGGLLRQVLAQDEERLVALRAALGESLGVNLAVVSAVLPELELLVGPQPPAQAMRSIEAQNRFLFVLEDFLACFARPEAPLVVFLDDLQWADTGTMALLTSLATGRRLEHLLLVGAYRDGEVGPTHPLRETLERVRSAGAAVEEVRLASLRTGDLRQLVVDALRAEPEEAEALARILRRKTDGNPFFVGQFLKTLHADGLLRFDATRRRWGFDAEGIERADITDNVVELMTRKLRRLSLAAQKAVTLAACIGAELPLATLALLRERSPREVLLELGEALSEGLLLPLDERAGASGDAGPERLRFLHDRVQQAAYALIPEDQRRVVHLRIGRLLLAGCGPSVPDEALFEVTHHLNLGAELVVDEEERLRLCFLDLRAGRRAKESAAFHVALGRFEAGLALLPEDRWESAYEPTLALSMEIAECRYLCGNLEEAERDFETLIARARSPLEKAEAYRMRLVEKESLARYAEAYETGLEALALLGDRFPAEPAAREAALAEELAHIRAALGERSIASLEELPVMADPRTRMAVTLMTAVWAPAYIVGHPELAFLFSARIVRLSLEHGNAEESAYGYVTHAIAVGPMHGDHRAGYEWGSLALRVNERFADRRLRAKVHQQFNAHVAPWSRPFSTSVLHAREARRSGLESGDFNYAGYGAFTESWAAFLESRDLARFEQELAPTVPLLERISMHSLADGLRLILGWARALAGRTPEPLSLSYEGFDEDRYERAYAENPFNLTFLHVARLHLRLCFGEQDLALESARRARAEGWAGAGTLWPVLLDAWSALALVGRLAAGSSAEHPGELGAARETRGRLATLAESCPENFLADELLLAAELERVEGRFGQALERYERAIAWTRQQGDARREAQACEAAARAWAERGRDGLSLALLGEARRAYLAWGALAKARALEELHPRLVGPGEARAAGPANLDLGSVLKASRAIAAEIELERLLATLVRLAIENAGAERGFLLEERGGRLLVVARGAAGGVALEEGPLEEHDLSAAVVRLVHRTGEHVIVDDAREDGRWFGAGDGRGAATRSILCAPIVHQGRRAGIFYLDNGVTPHAFGPERVETIRLLSAQAAIALENARLYGETRREVEARRRAEAALQEALDEVGRLRDRLHEENAYLQEEIRTQHNFEEIVGTSPALLETLRRVEQVAGTDSTVLITGETGSGKELIARAIHSRSARSGRPLVKVNCGAIPVGLVESELFGHARGAFTGALADRVGRFELADGGTLFLDEVGELPLDTQVRLLRVLQEREFEPVGSSKTRRVDVRVIAATNRDLSRAVREGRFRADLLYRLDVFPIRVPPLRERLSDVPLLTSFLVTELAKKLGKPLAGFGQASLERLLAYDWPGNVRELENVVERAAIVATSPVLELGADPLGTPLPAAPQGTLAELEREHVLRALRASGGVVEGPRGAARRLGLHPNTLRSRIKRMGIERTHYEIS